MVLFFLRNTFLILQATKILKMLSTNQRLRLQNAQIVVFRKKSNTLSDFGDRNAFRRWFHSGVVLFFHCRFTEQQIDNMQLDQIEAKNVIFPCVGYSYLSL